MGASLEWGYSQMDGLYWRVLWKTYETYGNLHIVPGRIDAQVWYIILILFIIIYLSIYLSIYLYIYIHIHIYICIYVYIGCWREGEPSSHHRTMDPLPIAQGLFVTSLKSEMFCWFSMWLQSSPWVFRALLHDANNHGSPTIKNVKRGLSSNRNRALLGTVVVQVFLLVKQKTEVSKNTGSPESSIYRWIFYYKHL